jgi:ribosomal protein S18 acetylase RimI-like enzyme
MGLNGRGHGVPRTDGGGDRPERKDPVNPVSAGRSEHGAPVLRAGTSQDAPAAAALHAGQISQGFLSLLGPRFLSRLYRRISLDPSSFLIVAVEGGNSVGFIAGSTDVRALYRSFLWRDGVTAALGVLRDLIPNWRRVVETLHHGSSDGVGTGRGAELLAVAVGRSHKGLGIGRALVEAFLREVTRRGLSEAHVVVASDNTSAVRLYERAGFVVASQFELHPGTESLVMQWERIDPDPNADTGAQ